MGDGVGSLVPRGWERMGVGLECMESCVGTSGLSGISCHQNFHWACWYGIPSFPGRLHF